MRKKENETMSKFEMTEDEFNLKMNTTSIVGHEYGLKEAATIIMEKAQEEFSYGNDEIAQKFRSLSGLMENAAHKHRVKAHEADPNIPL